MTEGLAALSKMVKVVMSYRPAKPAKDGTKEARAAPPKRFKS